MTASSAKTAKVVSTAEWQTRVDLAACYRLVFHYGWHHLILNHISARVPGPVSRPWPSTTVLWIFFIRCHGCSMSLILFPKIIRIKSLLPFQKWPRGWHFFKAVLNLAKSPPWETYRTWKNIVIL